MTYRCAVIGNPIAHSQSPRIQGELARRYGVDLQYDRMLAEPDTFAATVAAFFHSGGRGLNITLPFKETAFALAARRSRYAETAAAANTLWMQDGELWADNTDGRGLVRALTEVHGQSLNGAQILLLGAGGAARGVILPLLEAGAARIDILNRTAAKARALAAQYEAGVSAVEVPAQAYDLIINATSSGLGDAGFSLDPLCLGGGSFCYEMMYGRETPFMRWARQHGCTRIADGYSMLENQAWFSFHIWFGHLIAQDNT